MLSEAIEKKIEELNEELKRKITDGEFEDYLTECAENNGDLNEEDLAGKLEAEADGITDFIGLNYPERLRE